MHDLEFIKNEPKTFDAAMSARGIEITADKILGLDTKRRSLITKVQELRQQKNSLVKKISELKSQNRDISELTKQTKDISLSLKELELSLDNSTELEYLLSTLPNIPAEIVPVGNDESSNIEVRKYKTPRTFSFIPKAHDELGESLCLMDFENSAKISGARFVTLNGALAQMERALINFMLDLHTQNFGYTEVSHPYLVKDQAMYGVGQLPKFDKDSFKTTNGLRLIPTSEVFLTNIFADTIVKSEDLPCRFTAAAACFRSEAGSAGRDTRGMIRQHQFHKVELVSITKPQESQLELGRMIGIAEEILKLLDIPYRVMLLSSGDMGFSAHVTYDIEVWLPSQNTYREISSCSNCGDFQSRRMKTRYKQNHKTEFVHTLNGSALAIGRTIVAIMENYQNQDGSISIPKVLQPYMNNRSLI